MMMKEFCDEIPPATRERLPRYFRIFRAFLLENRLRVTSEELAAALGCQAPQVRADLRWVRGAGQRGYGYVVRELYTEIASYLGIGVGYRAVCIGNIYPGMEGQFGRCGVRMLACLPDPAEKTETEELADRLRTLAPDIVLLSPTCRDPKALTDILSECGIGGVLNLTESVVDVPGAAVQSHSLSDDLLLLCAKMKEKGERV